MTIWLGFPEESSSNGAGSGTDDVQTLIDEIQTKDQEIDQLQDQIANELKTLDDELKTAEKEDFVSTATLSDITVSDSTTWSEIIIAYNSAWGMESGAAKDALEDKLFLIRQHTA